MPERDEPGIAEQQVVGGGIEREAQRLHQEYGIGEERRDDEQDREQREGEALMGRHARDVGRGEGGGFAGHVTPSVRTGRPA